MVTMVSESCQRQSVVNLDFSYDPHLLVNTNSFPCLQAMYSWAKPNSHKLLANKDDDFILGQHVSDEVKDVWLFLLLLDNQHCLLYCVNSLRPREIEMAFKYITQMEAEKGALAQLQLFLNCTKDDKKKKLKLFYSSHGN